MRFQIAERLRPFCHLPGTATLVPGCGYQVQIFPCLIRLYHLKEATPLLLKELRFAFKGPIQQFTVCNDLERGKITVWGKTAEGWMRYYLISDQRQEGIHLFVDRAPLDQFPIIQESLQHFLHPHETLEILGNGSPFQPYHIPPCDRLSLGCHKAQDWELVKRRLSLAEILPIWHRLGQLLPAVPVPQDSYPGTLALLATCRDHLAQGKPEETQQCLLNLIQAGFSHLLVPRLEDTDYQGLVPMQPLVNEKISPLILLIEGARLIRQLFVQQEPGTLTILPHLLPSLPSGRLLDVPLEGGGRLSFEWTKKTIRRLILDVEQDQELFLQFRSHVRSYRLREQTKTKGERKNCQQSLYLKKNCHYLFDNFN